MSDVALLNPQSCGELFRSEFTARLRQQQLRLLCISTSTSAFSEALTLARIAKVHDPNIVVILGGAHEDDSLVRAVEVSPAVDFSVRGDGEYALRELGTLALSSPGASLAELKRIVQERALPESPLRRLDFPGRAIISFVAPDGGVRRTIAHILCAANQGLRAASLDLGELPLMPRNLLLEEDTRQFSIFRRHGRNRRTAQIMTQRGCYWSCTFCSESSAHQPQAKVTHKTLESVIHEIDCALAMGYEAVFFDDSTFTSLRQVRRQQFLEGLYGYLAERARSHGLEWGCQTRVDQVDIPTLRGMKEAGCSYVYFGVESSSAEMLREMHKGLPAGSERACLQRAFDAVNEVGVRVGVSLIFGVAHGGVDTTRETKETVLETLRFVRDQAQFGNLVCASLNLATYYPGTRMTSESGEDFDFSQPIRHRGYPWNRYEEGEGHHPGGVDYDLADFIVRSATELLGEYLMDQDLHCIDELLRPYREGKLPYGRVVYLNHASLTQPLAGARRAARVDGTDKAHDVTSRARVFAAALMNVPMAHAERIALTRNTTEAIAYAVRIAGSHCGRRPVRILTTNVENFSVDRVLRVNQDHANAHGRDPWSSFQDFGCRLAEAANVSATPTGFLIDTVDISDAAAPADVPGRFAEGIRHDTTMVVFSHVVRDDGRILDAAGICRAVRDAKPDAWIVVDGAQALGALATVDVEALGCDFYAAAPHKTIGSYPLGLLYMGDRALRHLRLLSEWPSLEFTAPHGAFASNLGMREAGALSLREVHSFIGAVEELRERKLLDGSSMLPLHRHRRQLRDAFLAELRLLGQEHTVLDADGVQTPFIAALRFPGYDTRSIAEMLWREYWVFVSYVARTDVLRVSFGANNREADARVAARAVAACCNRLGVGPHVVGRPQ
ncbi:MAG: aminotransferase class V-fold PLP-dependent enzyme [Gemmatimonadaceae bacterium]